MSDTVKDYVPKSVPVKAVQFTGSNPYIVWRFCKSIFWVPRGYDHGLRKPSEYDRGNGHILENCNPFLVFMDKDDVCYRVDINDWIVLNEGGIYQPMTKAMFEKMYIAMEVEQQ